MRLKIGQSSSPISRVIPSTTQPTSTAPTSAVPTKADLSISFTDIQPSVEPLMIKVHVPAYDPTTTNNLVSLTAVVIGFGAGKPSDANGWIASSHPKETITSAPTTSTVAPATVTTAAASTPTTAPAAVVTSTPTTGALAATPTVTTPGVAVAPTAPAVTASTAGSSTTYLPGPAGGDVVFLIPNVPNGRFEVQLIEGYDL